MTDTTDDIYKKQLEIWLAKPAMVRLKRTLQDNDDTHTFWNYFKNKKAKIRNNQDQTGSE